jgi:hypothetical protein
MTMRRCCAVLLLLMLPAVAAAQSAQTRGTLSANGAVTLDVTGMGTGSITVSGTYSGTVNFEVIGGPGTAAVTVDCATPAAPGTAVNSTTSTGVWTCPVAGLSLLQARMSDYVSGTAVIDLKAAPGGGGSGGGGSATASLTLQEADDASIATGQTADVVVGLGQAYDGSVWRRVTFGTAGTASTQVWTVQGIASMTPLAGNITQVLGSAIGATNPIPVRAANSTGYIADDVADDAASSGNPVPVGGLVETAPSAITLLADGDRMYLSGDPDRALFARPFSYADVLAERDTNTDGASTAFDSGLAAPGASIRIYLTSCTLSNSSASFITVDIRDGAAGSVLYTIPVPATGGAVQTWPAPLKFTANTAVAYDASGATTTLTISCSGFKSKVG